MNDLSISKNNQELIQEIEALHQKIALFTPEELLQRSQKLTHYRAQSSSTLQKSKHDSWVEVNTFASERIKQSEYPTWNHVREINKILDPNKGGEVRNVEIFIGQHSAPSPNELPTLLDHYINHILPPTESLHPLIHATAARYWLVTLHPFIDGNGRTSNLICDWILALNGYLPLTHQLKVDSLIGGWGPRSQFSNFDFAFSKTMNAIKNSCLLFLED